MWIFLANYNALEILVSATETASERECREVVVLLLHRSIGSGMILWEDRLLQQSET